MLPDFKMSAGTLIPPLSARLRVDGNHVPLSSATIRVTKDFGFYDETFVAPVSPSDSTLVTYAWQAGDTDTRGLFQTFWTIITVAGEIVTLPGQVFEVV